MRYILIAICIIATALWWSFIHTSPIKFKDFGGRVQIVEDNLPVRNHIKEGDTVLLINIEYLSTKDHEWLITHGERYGDTILHPHDHTPWYRVVDQKLAVACKK